jgi:hypothetical protein
MDFADQTGQPVKAIYQLLEPDGKLPKNAHVQGTFLSGLFCVHRSLIFLLSQHHPLFC